MIETLSKYGLSSLVGFVLGLIGVWWLEPRTSGGIALTILLIVSFFLIFKSVIVFLLKKYRSSDSEIEPKKGAIWLPGDD